MNEGRATVREEAELLREIPALRRPRTWKDDVRERVTERRRQRAFVRDPEGADEGFVEESAVDAVPLRSRPPEAPLEADVSEPLEVFELGEPLIEDVPRPPAVEPFSRGARSTPSERWTLDGEDTDGTEPDEPRWAMDAPEVDPEVEPLERPAYFVERFHAAAVDLALLVSLFLTVVYFTSRVAHVPVGGLRPTWPYLAGYLAFLGLTYAVYFTGTCGRTLGKILCGLWVVDVSGRPPGYLNALGRAIVAIAGIALGGLGLVSIFFDPARRAVHDRLFRTRVVRL